MSGTSPKHRVTFLFDVDNTLIDNDRAKKDLSARIAELLGVAGERRFWELYEEVRHDLGLVNIPLILARYDDELDADSSLDDTERRRLRFALADIVMGFPYREYLYPGAMDAVRKARTAGAGCCSLRRRCHVPAAQDLAYWSRSRSRRQRPRLRPQARSPG